MRTGIANLPLHNGKAPAWLFQRMVKLARATGIVIIEEFGRDTLLERLSDPFWFQAFGCILGFDWHSSGITTTVCSALKQGFSGLENEYGIFFAGGKGKHSRKTPDEISSFADRFSFSPDDFIYASRMSAKVDSSAVQDGYQIYQHTFAFTKDGLWTVVQQGMNEATRYARRYHWLSKDLSDFVSEPHRGIITVKREKQVLNLVSHKSEKARGVITGLSGWNPDKTISELKSLATLDMPERHPIFSSDVSRAKIRRILVSTYENPPSNFEELLGRHGVGPKTIRALSLLSELVWGTPPDWTDPARFSFAHGGKDGYPYPVDKNTYDKSIAILERAIAKAKISQNEKDKAFGRLRRLL
ncbi:MAG: hypothetical protein B6D65_03820 [candidate division Zixibacteria bacterium 4484_93]|nr:MAG: hypothetical protein B6D65_03820 [candidate division Zixibacteria bacterium 4484_93]